MRFFMLFYKLTIYLQEESIIAMHRTMQRSLDNMLLMATELCRGMGMDVSSLHEALEEEGQVQ
jgi:hypothetical protein